MNFETKEPNPQHAGVYDIDPREILKMKDQMILVDVRQPEEFKGELGHIPGAQLIVLDTLAKQIEKIPKDKTVVFVCRSGGRSAKATSFALGNGYKNVFNMKGGMLLWNELHFPTEV